MNEQQHLETLSDIKRIMERSTRFISLSGLGGISAGICALIGAWVARNIIQNYYGASTGDYYKPIRHTRDPLDALTLQLFMVAILVLIAALATGTYFTWRKARRQNLRIWDASARKVFVNLAIPLGAGGLFILGLLFNNNYVGLIAPSCLVFYGLALINASKYTVTDIRYLGIAEVLLGIICMVNPNNGLLFWAIGFGVLHIIYGALMWWKYDRVTTDN